MFLYLQTQLFVSLSLVYFSLCVDCLVKMLKNTVFFSGSFHQVLWVNEEVSTSETAVRPIFIFINIIIALLIFIFIKFLASSHDAVFDAI